MWQNQNLTAKTKAQNKLSQSNALCNVTLTAKVLASLRIPTLSQVPTGPKDVKRVLPVTAASPAHACGGRQAAEEPVLTAFSHVATEMSNQSLKLSHVSTGCYCQPLPCLCRSENAK